MQGLESSCKDTQKALEKTAVHGTILGGGVRALNPPPYSASAGCSWSSTALTPGASTSNESYRKSRVFNIHQKLRELYLEECRNGQPSPHLPLPLRNLKRSSRLLEKLVGRENLNTLIVNLYPGDEGYSLSLRLQGKVPAALGSQAGRSQGSEAVIETMRWPYSDDELLRCIDREEIPTTLVDLLDADHSELFYQGCIIAEIRDSRLTFPHSADFETHHVLLKPTTQSVLNDVNLLSSTHDLSAEERLSLESQLIQATAPPLCLDPNPKVGLLMNNLQAKKHRFSTTPLRRTARKFSQVTVNRKRKLDPYVVNNTLPLYDFIANKRVKAGPLGTMEKVLPLPPTIPLMEPFIFTELEDVSEVFKHAKNYERPVDTGDMSASVVEEYVLEMEKDNGSIFYIKLTILQRLSNSEYLGELYVDRDYKPGELKGASCRFALGTRDHANRYIEQFTEIFTEEGRKSVRITHTVSGQQGRVTCTQGMKERIGQPQSPSNSAIHPQLMHLPHARNNLTIPDYNFPPFPSLSSVQKDTSVPPNVNVHQIHQLQTQTPQQQSQYSQAAMNYITSSTIQSLLSNARNAAAFGETGTRVMTNGPVDTAQSPVGIIAHQLTNATVHYQPAPQTTVASASAKTSRPALSSNPQIKALATSLMNSAQQYELQLQSQAQAQAQAQVQAQATAPAAAAQNSALINLLNAATPLGPKLVTRKTTSLNTRPCDPNLTTVLSNSGNNSKLLVNNHLRYSFPFPNQLVGQTTGNAATQQTTYSLSTLTQQPGHTFTLTSSSGDQPVFTVVQPSPNFSLPTVQGQTFQISTGATAPTITISAPGVAVSNQFSSQSLTVNPTQLIAVNFQSTNNPPPNRSVTSQNLSNKTFTMQANSQQVAKADGTRMTTHRGTAQRRLSNPFQQVSNTSELNKLLVSDRSDSRVITERHIAEKVEQTNVRLSQVLGESKVANESKLSQPLSSTETSSLSTNMPGLSALLAGTPSADNPIPGASNSSHLVEERLGPPSSATFTSPPPAPSPGQNITFQSSTFGSSPNHIFNSVNSNSPLPSLMSPGFTSPSPKSQLRFQGASPSSKDSVGITSPLSSPPISTPGNIQNLNFQALPGMIIPISYAVINPTTTTSTTTTAPTMVVSNSSAVAGSVLSLPVAQIMGSGGKGTNSRSAPASISIPQGTAQSIQLVSQLQRPGSRSNSNQLQGAKTVQSLAVRNVVSDQRPTIKMATGATAPAQLQINSGGSQMVALSQQQFLQLQKHAFSSRSLTAQKNPVSPSAIANKHRRRSNAADPNK